MDVFGHTTSNQCTIVFQFTQTAKQNPDLDVNIPLFFYTYLTIILNNFYFILCTQTAIQDPDPEVSTPLDSSFLEDESEPQWFREITDASDEENGKPIYISMVHTKTQRIFLQY